MRKLRSLLQNLYCWQYSEGLQYSLLAFETINTDKQKIFFLSVCASKRYWFKHLLHPQNTGAGTFAAFLKFKNCMSRSTLQCNINFRARQRGEEKALLPRTSKGLEQQRPGSENNPETWLHQLDQTVVSTFKRQHWQLLWGWGGGRVSRMNGEQVKKWF